MAEHNERICGVCENEPGITASECDTEIISGDTCAVCPGCGSVIKNYDIEPTRHVKL